MSKKEIRLLELKTKAHDVLISFEHKEGSRMVDIKELGTIMRALGVNPTPTHISHLTEVWRHQCTQSNNMHFMPCLCRVGATTKLSFAHNCCG